MSVFTKKIRSYGNTLSSGTKVNKTCICYLRFAPDSALEVFCLWYYAISTNVVIKNAGPVNIGRSLSDTSRECRYLDFQMIFWRKLMFFVAVEHRSF